ncbi:unnamed protein product [Lampetra planeri]
MRRNGQPVREGGRNIFRHDFVMLPLNLAQCHWCLIVIDIRARRIVMYDGLGFVRRLGSWLPFLEAYVRDQGTEYGLDSSRWEFKAISGTRARSPSDTTWSITHVELNQCDTTSCGVYVAAVAEMFIKEAYPTVTDMNDRTMDTYRERMRRCIVAGSISE